jgi:hypothetical protein
LPGYEAPTAVALASAWIAFACSVAALLFALGDLAAVQAWMHALAIVALAQGAWVLLRFFSTGWLETFAYLFHWLFIGGACAASLLLQLEDTLQTHWPLLMAGLNTQVLLGAMAISGRPLVVRAKFSRALLAALLLVCGVAALVKFGFYIEQVGAVGDHLAIYTEGDAIRDASPWPVRILAAGAPLVAVMVLTQRGIPWPLQVLALAAISIEFAIGTRSRPIFLLAAVLALRQTWLVQGATLQRLALGAGLTSAVLVAAAVGYWREGYDVGWQAFALISLTSLAGTVQAALAGVELPGLESSVLTQLPALFVPSDLSRLDTVAKLVSAAALPATYELGYGLSSSAMLECALLLSPLACVLAYPALAWLVLRAVRAALQTPRAALHLLGVALLPTLFYVWRAELWQPLVAASKSLPYLLVLALAARSDVTVRQ